MSMYLQDDWPLMADGSRFDGENLWSLLRDRKSPFRADWDVQNLIKEIEDALHTRVTDIPFVYNGSNSYGFHLKLEGRPDAIARVCRADVNMPNYDGFPLARRVADTQFQAAAYQILQKNAAIRSSLLLYYRIPKLTDGPEVGVPGNILGRELLVLERVDGQNNVWWDIDRSQQDYLLQQAAAIRAELFNFDPPHEFAVTWFLERLFEHKPSHLPVPVADTRDFTLALFRAKIEATIRNLGDMIGWESDNVVVGPVALSAKQSLLRIIPLILPPEDEEHAPCLYRLVLDHGDFGIHNMQISMDKTNRPQIMSVYDWETGCVAPAILSDPLMAVAVDLIAGENAEPSFTRFSPGDSPQELEKYREWSCEYFQELYRRAPNYQKAIIAGRDARHLWFSLRDWRGQDPEGYFGALGTWAEKRIHELEPKST